MPKILATSATNGIEVSIKDLVVAETQANLEADLSVTIESNINASPIECATDTEMNAVLTAANLNKIYLFTGENGTYIEGDYYIIRRNEF